MDSKKLSADVTALLHAAGFENLSSHFNDENVVVEGESGAGRRVFRWAAAGFSHGAESTGFGGPNPQAPNVEHAVAPSAPGMQALIAPGLASAILEASPESLHALADRPRL
jgi:hypothetical protein